MLAMDQKSGARTIADFVQLHVEQERSGGILKVPATEIICIAA